MNRVGSARPHRCELSCLALLEYRSAGRQQYLYCPV